MAKKCPICGEPFDNIYGYCTSCEFDRSKMKWFRFNVFFLCHCINMVHLALGLAFLTSSYDLDEYPAHILYSVLFAVLCVAGLIARWRLAHYRANGPKLYVGFMIAMVVVNAAVSAVAFFSSEYDRQMFFSPYILFLILSALYLLVNSIYLNKRTHLFVK